MPNKRLSMIVFAFIGLLIVSISIEFGFEYLVSRNQWFGLIFGVGMMLIGVITYQYGKKNEI